LLKLGLGQRFGPPEPGRFLRNYFLRSSPFLPTMLPDQVLAAAS